MATLNTPYVFMLIILDRYLLWRLAIDWLIDLLIDCHGPSTEHVGSVNMVTR